MGRSVPHLHGGEGHTCDQSASCGQEAPGLVQALCLCQRDWRFSTGEKKLLKVNPLKSRLYIYIYTFLDYFLLLHHYFFNPENTVEENKCCTLIFVWSSFSAA